jgi:hypothetical protein
VSAGWRGSKGSIKSKRAHLKRIIGPIAGLEGADGIGREKFRGRANGSAKT